MSEALREESDIPDSYRKVAFGPKEIVIPEDWQHTYFSDVIEVNPTYDKPQSGTFDFVPMDAVSEDERRITYFTERSKSDCTTTWFKNGDTIYPKITPCTENGKIAFVKNVGTELASGSTEFVVFHPREEKTDPQFVYYLVNLPQFRSVTISLMEGSTNRQRVPNDIFNENLRIPVPPTPEQRRIAAVLSTVDKEIQQTEEIIETAEEVKHGLEQDLVLGRGLADEYREIKLGPRTVEVPTEWKRSTFDNIGIIEKGNTPKTSNDDYYGGDIVWVTPDDLSTLYEEGDGKYIDDSRRKLTREGLESTSVDIVEPNSVMFTSRSYGIGKTAICTVPAATNQGIIAFKPNSGMSPEYLYHYLNWIMDYIISLSGVSTFPEVSKSDVANISVPVPTPEHQERITEVLRQADEKIAREQERKQKLQELKRGLMQDLLTGQVRTPPDLLE